MSGNELIQVDTSENSFLINPENLNVVNSKKPRPIGNHNSFADQEEVNQAINELISNNIKTFCKK